MYAYIPLFQRNVHIYMIRIRMGMIFIHKKEESSGLLDSYIPTSDTSNKSDKPFTDQLPLQQSHLHCPTRLTAEHTTEKASVESVLLERTVAKFQNPQRILRSDFQVRR